MSCADPLTYLQPIVQVLQTHWPHNRSVHIVAHGHSVPAGYFATPMVQSFDAYPHLLHRHLKQVFPFAVINVICTAIGGEHAEQGAARFAEEVLCHRPDVLLIDYGLNDRRLGLQQAAQAWEQMIEQALERAAKIILVTPTWDCSQLPGAAAEERALLRQHAEQIRGLAARYQIGLADSFAAFEKATASEPLQNLLSWQNHPNQRGHQLVADQLAAWFSPFTL